MEQKDFNGLYKESKAYREAFDLALETALETQWLKAQDALDKATEEKHVKRNLELIDVFALAAGADVKQTKHFFESLAEIFSNEQLIDFNLIKRFEDLGHYLTKGQKERIRASENNYWSKKIYEGLYLNQEKKKYQEKLKVNLQLAFYNSSKGDLKWKK